MHVRTIEPFNFEARHAFEIEFSRAVLAWWRRRAAHTPILARLARIVLVWGVSSAWMERAGSLLHMRFRVAPSLGAERAAKIVAAQEAQNSQETWGADWCQPIP